MYIVKFHNGEYLVNTVRPTFSPEKVDAKRFFEKKEAWYFADTIGGQFALVPNVINLAKGY